MAKTLEDILHSMISFQKEFCSDIKLSYTCFYETVHELFIKGDIKMYTIEGKPRSPEEGKTKKGALYLRNDEETKCEIRKAANEKVENINKIYKVITNDPDYPMFNPKTRYEKGNKFTLRRLGKVVVVRTFRETIYNDDGRKERGDYMMMVKNENGETQEMYNDASD